MLTVLRCTTHTQIQMPWTHRWRNFLWVSVHGTKLGSIYYQQTNVNPCTNGRGRCLHRKGNRLFHRLGYHLCKRINCSNLGIGNLLLSYCLLGWRKIPRWTTWGNNHLSRRNRTLHAPQWRVPYTTKWGKTTSAAYTTVWGTAFSKV